MKVLPKQAVEEYGDGKTENTQTGADVADESQDVFMITGYTIHRRRIQ